MPGDAESEVLDNLCLPRCALVELPHHGSRDGLDPALLARLAPRIAAVSVGPNRYGHPTPQMMDLIRSDGIPCLRTDYYGDITLTVQHGGLAVRVAHMPS